MLNLCSKLFKKSKNEKGFSLLEVILTLIFLTIFGTSAANILIAQAGVFSQAQQRKGTMDEVKQAFNIFNYELLRLETSDITSISATQIDFVDSTGSSTNISSSTSNGITSVYLGNEVVIENVTNFEINYYDEDENELTETSGNIPFVRQIEISLVTAEESTEGVVDYSTIIIPRAFLGMTNFN